MALGTDPVIAIAIRLRDRLEGAAKEFDYKAAAASHAASREMAMLDALACRDAAKMLEKLGTEVTRLRLGIGHLRYGQMDRMELWAMSRTWNGDSAAALAAQPQESK